MLILIIFVSLFVLGKSIGYAIYEIKTNNNKPGGISIIGIAIITAIVTPYIFYIR